MGDAAGFMKHKRATPTRRPVPVRLRDWKEVYEPFLIQNGFLMRTPRGRVATALAYRRFGYAPPVDQQSGLGSLSGPPQPVQPGLFDA